MLNHIFQEDTICFSVRCHVFDFNYHFQTMDDYDLHWSKYLAYCSYCESTFGSEADFTKHTPDSISYGSSPTLIWNEARWAAAQQKIVFRLIKDAFTFKLSMGLI